MQKDKLKSFVFELVLWTTVLIITLVLSELVVRVYTMIYGRPILVSDTFRGYKHTTNNKFVYNYDGGQVANTTDSFGFIGQDDPSRLKRPLRIMVVGDSFTEALQVPWKENFCTRLEESLNRQGKSAWVINTGVSGYSPITEFQYFRRELKSFKPNVVILQMFSNDVFEDNKIAAMSTLDAQGLPLAISKYFRPSVSVPNEANPIFKIKEFLLRHSRLAESINQMIYKSFKKTKEQKKMCSKEEFNDERQFFSVDNNSSLMKNDSFRESSFARTFFYISNLRKEVEANGGKLVVMLIPHEAQMALETYQKHVYIYFKNPPVGTYLNDRLSIFCASENIPFIDIKTVFGVHLGEDIYLPNDGHLRPHGHQIVAATLSDFLMKDLADAK